MPMISSHRPRTTPVYPCSPAGPAPTLVCPCCCRFCARELEFTHSCKYPWDLTISERYFKSSNGSTFNSRVKLAQNQVKYFNFPDEVNSETLEFYWELLVFGPIRDNSKRSSKICLRGSCCLFPITENPKGCLKDSHEFACHGLVMNKN